MESSLPIPEQPQSTSLLDGWLQEFQIMPRLPVCRNAEQTPISSERAGFKTDRYQYQTAASTSGEIAVPTSDIPLQQQELSRQVVPRRA